MDIATLVGLFGGLAVIGSAIALGGSAGTFANVPSLAVVVGGTFMVTLCQISLAQFFGSFKVAARAFTAQGELDSVALDRRGGRARRRGAGRRACWRSRGARSPIAFPRGVGVKLCIDGHAPDMVRAMLAKEINAGAGAPARPASACSSSIATAAPAMGMIGTLIGLVQMLANMDDPKSIGPAMAIALLTTLYGAIIANAIARADRREAQDDRRRPSGTNRLLVLESINAIQERHEPARALPGAR